MRRSQLQAYTQWLSQPNMWREEIIAVHRDAAPLKDLPRIRRSLLELRDAMVDLENQEGNLLRDVTREHRLSVRNLIHYIAMRRKDLRELQTGLANIGMSSIGRSEAYALSSVNSVIDLADHILGERRAVKPAAPCSHVVGAKLLDKHTRNLLGNPRADRTVRIMVTMPSEAAHDYGLVRDLLDNGMDCMRINC